MQTEVFTFGNGKKKNILTVTFLMYRNLCDIFCNVNEVWDTKLMEKIVH